MCALRKSRLPKKEKVCKEVLCFVGQPHEHFNQERPEGTEPPEASCSFEVFLAATVAKRQMSAVFLPKGPIWGAETKARAPRGGHAYQFILAKTLI